MPIDPSIAALFQPQSAQPDQSMMADALRQREQLGMLAQLSGNQTAQPFAQTVLKGVADERDQASADAQRQAQRQMTLAQMMETARRDAIDNKRQDAALAETTRYHGAEEALRRAELERLRAATGAGADKKQEAMDLREQKAKDEILGKLGKDVSEAVGKSSLLVKNADRRNASQRFKAAVLDENGNIKPLNNTMLREAITQYNGVLGGSNSLGGLEELTPHTFKGGAAKYLEYVTGHPEDAGAQPFVSQMLKNVEREEGLIGQQNLTALQQQMAAHPVAFQKYRTEAQNMLKAHGVSPDMYDPETLLPITKAAAQGSGADKKAVGPHGATVKQNGHTYTWNPASGKYE